MKNFVHNRPARLTAAFDVEEDTVSDTITTIFAIAAGSPADQWIRKRGVDMAGKRLERGKLTMKVVVSRSSIDVSVLSHKDAKTGEPFVQKRTHWVADQFVWFIKGLKKRRIPANLDQDFAKYLAAKKAIVISPLPKVKVTPILEDDNMDVPVTIMDGIFTSLS